MVRRAATVLLLLAGSFATTVALQVHGGAYEAEFSETMDEPAHYVTGLLVHDWVKAGMPRPLGGFYRAFTERYSNVGIGHWPPGFYVLQSAWMLVFGESRESMLVLMAVLQAIFVTATVLMLRSALPTPYALGAGVLLLTTPLAQVSSRSLMGEVPMALLVLAAGWVWRGYLRNGSAWSAAGFGLLASAALLTKGTGVMLAPLPPVSLLLSGQARGLTRGRFWLPAVMVAVLCGGWYARVPGALHEQVAWFGGLAFMPERVPESLAFLVDQLTPLLAVAALAGMFLKMRDARRGRAGDAIWLVGGIVVICSILFRAIVAVWEPRHLLMCAPWVLLFAAEGVRRAIALPGLWGKAACGTYVVALVGISGWNVMRVPGKTRLGLREAVGLVLELPEAAGADVLVVSDLRGEGAVTAEFAMRERRPGRRVLRSSVELAETSFLGDEYQGKFRDEGEVRRHLESRGRLVVVLDTPTRPFPHAERVWKVVLHAANGWKRLGAAAGIQVWIREVHRGR